MLLSGELGRPPVGFIFDSARLIDIVDGLRPENLSRCLGEIE